MSRRTRKSRTHQTTFRTRLTPHSKEDPETSTQETAKKKKSRKTVRPKTGAETKKPKIYEDRTGWESIESDN